MGTWGGRSKLGMALGDIKIEKQILVKEENNQSAYAVLCYTMLCCSVRSKGKTCSQGLPLRLFLLGRAMRLSSYRIVSIINHVLMYS